MTIVPWFCSTLKYYRREWGDLLTFKLLKINSRPVNWVAMLARLEVNQLYFLPGVQFTIDQVGNVNILKNRCQHIQWVFQAQYTHTYFGSSYHTKHVLNNFCCLYSVDLNFILSKVNLHSSKKRRIYHLRTHGNKFSCYTII